MVLRTHFYCSVYVHSLFSMLDQNARQPYSNLSLGVSGLCCGNNNLYINESPLMHPVSWAMVMALEAWYFLLNNYCERGKIVMLSCPRFSIVLDHPVAYEFPVWTIVQRMLVCFVIMVLSHGKIQVTIYAIVSYAEVLRVGFNKTFTRCLIHPS